jgi:hypothetical protein
VHHPQRLEAQALNDEKVPADIRATLFESPLDFRSPMGFVFYMAMISACCADMLSMSCSVLSMRKHCCALAASLAAVLACAYVLFMRSLPEPGLCSSPCCAMLAPKTPQYATEGVYHYSLSFSAMEDSVGCKRWSLECGAEAVEQSLQQCTAFSLKCLHLHGPGLWMT